MRISFLILAVGCWVNLCTLASASTLSISPTRLTISPNDKINVFKLENAGDENALVEVELYKWTDSNDREALAPTDDFAVAPPVFEIKPNETQTLRLAFRQTGEVEDERMYRLIIKEIPSEVGPANGVGFAVEMSLPVFLVPEGASAKPIWSVRWKDVATPELNLANQGNAHLRVRSLELFGDPDGDPLLKSDASAYVLPGKERSWPIDAAIARLKGPVLIKAETTRGPIETEILLPGG